MARGTDTIVQVLEFIRGNHHGCDSKATADVACSLRFPRDINRRSWLSGTRYQVWACILQPPEIEERELPVMWYLPWAPKCLMAMLARKTETKVPSTSQSISIARMLRLMSFWILSMKSVEGLFFIWAIKMKIWLETKNMRRNLTDASIFSRVSLNTSRWQTSDACKCL